MIAIIARTYIFKITFLFTLGACLVSCSEDTKTVYVDRPIKTAPELALAEKIEPLTLEFEKEALVVGDEITFTAKGGTPPYKFFCDGSIKEVESKTVLKCRATSAGAGFAIVRDRRYQESFQRFWVEDKLRVYVNTYNYRGDQTPKRAPDSEMQGNWEAILLRRSKGSLSAFNGMPPYTFSVKTNPYDPTFEINSKTGEFTTGVDTTDVTFIVTDSHGKSATTDLDTDKSSLSDSRIRFRTSTVKPGDRDFSYDLQGATSKDLLHSEKMALASNDTLIVAGEMSVEKNTGVEHIIGIKKISKDGKPIRSFGKNGLAEISQKASLILALAAAENDSVLLALEHGVDENHTGILKIKSDGSLDPEFGDQGMISLSWQFTWPCSILVVEDGYLIVGSKNKIQDSKFDTVISKFNLQGVPDKSFGNEGSMVVPIKLRSFATHFALIQESNDSTKQKIIITGSNENFQRVQVVRLSSDGSLDRNFGKDGVFDFGLDFNMPDRESHFQSLSQEAYNVAIVSNGFIAVTGQANQVPFIFFLTRDGQKTDLRQYIADSSAYLFFQRANDILTGTIVPFFIEYEPLEFALLMPSQSIGRSTYNDSGVYFGSLNKPEYRTKLWEKIDKIYDSSNESIYCQKESPKQLLKLSDGRIITLEWGRSIVRAYMPLR